MMHHPDVKKHLEAFFSIDKTSLSWFQIKYGQLREITENWMQSVVILDKQEQL